MLAETTRRDASLVLVLACASGLLAASVTPSIQFALVLGVATLMASVIMARAGRLLNPAWVIVAELYVILPVGGLLSSADTNLSGLGLLILVLSPFVAVPLLTRPETRPRLVLLTPLVLLLLLAGLSLLWSPEPSYGLDKLITSVLTALMPAAFILILAPGLNRPSWPLIAGAAFVTALALLAFGVASPHYPGRVTLFEANPIPEARAVFVGALVVLFGPFRKVAKLGIAPVILAAGLATVSVGPAVGLVLGASAGAIEALRCADRADRRAIVGWVALELGIALLVVASVWGAIDIGIRLLTDVAGEPNVSSRATYLGAAGSLFLSAPVLGVGLGGFAATGLDLYPHNLIAEVGAELGSIGILALLAWFGLALRGAARSPILVALVVATGTYSLFSGSLPYNAEFWMFSALAVSRLSVGGSPGARTATRVAYV